MAMTTVQDVVGYTFRQYPRLFAGAIRAYIRFNDLVLIYWDAGRQTAADKGTLLSHALEALRESLALSRNEAWSTSEKMTYNSPQRHP